MRHKRPPLPGSSPFWAQQPTIRDGGGEVERERLSRSLGAHDTGRGSPQAYSATTGEHNRLDERRAAIEDVDDAGLQRVGRRGRIRMELVAIALGAVFVAGMFLKPWGGGSAAPVTATPSPTGTQEIAAATASARAPGFDPDVTVAQGAIGPDSTASLPPWLSIANSPLASSIDWSTLLAGDRHNNWGIAMAVIPPGPESAYGSPPVMPQLSWMPANAPASTQILVPVRPGRLYALGVTWPASVQPTGMTFQYLGTDPSLAASTGNRPFTAIRIADAVMSTPRPTLAPQDFISGTYWLPPSLEQLGELWAPALWFRGTLAAGWPSGDYLVRIQTKSATFGLTLRLQRVG